MANDPSSSLTSLYTHLQTLIKKWVYDKTEVDNKLSNKENTSNKITQWSNSPDDNKYPSEKLVKNSLDNKASTTDLINGLQNIGGWTIHTVYNVRGSASAYDISNGLLYNQQSPVFFLVKNTIGDNQANATLKYYPNGNNITIMDTFSSNYSPIQQGVWKKDTWALFFCQGDGTVQLRCVFYDSSDIDDIKNKLSILGIEDLPYYVVSSVTKDTKKAIYNVNDTAILNGNGFYLKIPYYETSTDVRVSISGSYYYIKQGSVYLTESKANGHLLKLRFNSGIFELLEIYDNDKLIPSFSDLSSVATSGSYNDLSDKPTIPSASTSTPSADTTSGSVGTGTTWARSNHTHPKSSLYAEANHTHSEYVNPTIIDNLTTDDATKVLSAKQGKVLNDLIGDAIEYINQ